MRDTRLFSQVTVVMGKMLKTAMVTPTEETASALQGCCVLALLKGSVILAVCASDDM